MPDICSTSLGSRIFSETGLTEVLRVSVPTEYSYQLLDCSGIGNRSQGANINISLNLMNLLRNVIALTFNIHQIIENYMTPISHFDVHGTWAVCIWHTSALWPIYPCAKWSAPPSLPCWLQHISLFFMNMFPRQFFFPLSKLLQPSPFLLLCPVPFSTGQFAACAGWQSPFTIRGSRDFRMVVRVFCVCNPFALHWGSSAGSLLPRLGYQHHKPACTLHSWAPTGHERSTHLFLETLPPVSCFFFVVSRSPGLHSSLSQSH